MTQNSFPMKEWHVEHMEKMVLKFVRGLSPDATAWERKSYKRYGRTANVCKQIRYDIKHGATHEQLISFLEKVRNDSVLIGIDGSLERLQELENEFLSENSLNMTVLRK